MGNEIDARRDEVIGIVDSTLAYAHQLFANAWRLKQLMARPEVPGDAYVRLSEAVALLSLVLNRNNAANETALSRLDEIAATLPIRHIG